MSRDKATEMRIREREQADIEHERQDRERFDEPRTYRCRWCGASVIDTADAAIEHERTACAGEPGIRTAGQIAADELKGR